ncbi:STAS domain-containing protein [Streptomyces canus]|uniref:STAS domain-containing protein n=1 Tax=Streptomyces canus TaxID=58343 RepID=UPI0037225220
MDLATAGFLAEHPDAATATDLPDLLVDLRHVEFFDCSGLRVLRRAESRARGGRLRVVTDGPRLHWPLRASGLWRRFPPLLEFPEFPEFPERRRDPRVRRTAPLRPPALGAGSRGSVRGAALPNCGPLGQVTGTTRPRSLRTRRRSWRRRSSRTRWRRCVRRRRACPAIRRRP